MRFAACSVRRIQGRAKMNHGAHLVLALTLAVSAGFSSQAADLSAQETRFLEEAAVSGTFEMQASQMALQSAAQDRVKEFARLMLVQHEQIDAALKRVARDRNMVLPVSLDGDRQSSLGDLQQAKGADFDRRYIEHVAIGEHERAVELFSRAARESQDGDVKAFAAETVALLLQHLGKARMIAQAHAIGDKDGAPASATPGLSRGEAAPQTAQPTREGAPGTPEEAAESQ